MDWDTGEVSRLDGAAARQSVMHSDLLVKLRISFILKVELPVPFAGGTPCDFFDRLYASPPPLLSWFWSKLFPTRWHETMASGKTRLLTCEGGFKD
jgi:hypothetical protein